MIAHLFLALPLLTPPAPSEDSIASVQWALAEAMTPEARISALDRVAEFAVESEGSDWTECTKLIAEVIWDEDHAVRMHAVKLMGRGFEEEVSVEQLSARCKSWPKEQAALTLVLIELSGTQAPEDSKDRVTGIADPKTRKVTRESAELHLKNLDELREALVEMLKAYESPKVAGAYVDLLGFDPGPEQEIILEGLLHMGSMEALDSLVGLLEPCQAQIEQRTKALKEAEKRRKKRKKESKKKNRQRSSDSPLGKDFEKLQESVFDLEVLLEEKRLERAKDWGEVVCKKLHLLAEKLDLSNPPRRMNPVRRWKIWRKKVLDPKPKAAAPPTAPTD